MMLLRRDANMSAAGFKGENNVRTFSFFLQPDFSLYSFSAALEVLRLANEVIGEHVYEWHVVSIDGKPVASNSQHAVNADLSLARERECFPRPYAQQTVVVCGGDSYPVANPPLSGRLKECRRRCWDIVSLASGSVALAQSGIADGHRCAVHWELFPIFAEMFPAVSSTQAAFEEDSQIYTCSGGSATFDMFLHIVKRDHGEAVATRMCDKGVAHGIRSVGDKQRLPIRSEMSRNHQAVMAIIDMMEAHISDPVPIETLVRPIGISRRNLERLFNREFGLSPARYYLELRIERAHLLMKSSNLSVLEVAIACGFVAASHFSKVYRRSYGCSPSQAKVIGETKNKPGATMERTGRPPSDKKFDIAGSIKYTAGATASPIK